MVSLLIESQVGMIAHQHIIVSVKSQAPHRDCPIGPAPKLAPLIAAIVPVATGIGGITVEIVGGHQIRMGMTVVQLPDGGTAQGSIVNSHIVNGTDEKITGYPVNQRRWTRRCRVWAADFAVPSRVFPYRQNACTWCPGCRCRQMPNGSSDPAT